MSEITEIDNTVPASPEKPKRVYKPRTKSPVIEPIAEIPVPIAAPSAPNPTILALEADILELVRHRSAALNEVAASGHALNAASARMASAKEQLQSLEKEVQYRLALIHQMKGGAPQIEYQTQIPPMQFSVGPHIDQQRQPAYEVPNGQGVSIPPGVGSIPSGSGQSGYAQQRQPRTESAEDVRAAM